MGAGSRRGRRRLVLTCEHGGHRVPAAQAALFAGAGKTLASHRGWDPGALQLARELARRLGAPLVASQVSRLVVDLNRSPDHRALLSSWTRALDPGERQQLLERHYEPHRARVLEAIRAQARGGKCVLHVAVHSFVPVLDGKARRADIGLLYDPARSGEAQLYREWKRAIRAADGTLRVLANHPYQGRSDGLTTSLRRRFPPGRYLGFELELNQALVLGPARRWREVRGLLARTLAEVLTS